MNRCCIFLSLLTVAACTKKNDTNTNPAGNAGKLNFVLDDSTYHKGGSASGPVTIAHTETVVSTPLTLELAPDQSWMLYRGDTLPYRADRSAFGKSPFRNADYGEVKLLGDSVYAYTIKYLGGHFTEEVHLRGHRIN